MSSSVPMNIPFGADAVTESQVTLVNGQPSYRLPSVTIEPARAMRLNSGGLVFGDPPPLTTMPTVADQLDFLSAHFQHHCGLWAKYARLFVERYFAFIQDEIASHEAELKDRLERFGSLYEIDHWAFSALRPLPRAHLTVAGSRTGLPSQNLLRTDFAFWTGTVFIAIDLVGGATRGQAEAQWRDRLERAGVQVLEIPHEVLSGTDREAFATFLPQGLQAFWRDEALPTGPFRSDAGPLVLPD